MQGCGARTNIAVMVIRLDAKPQPTLPLQPQQRLPPAATLQVRESRDHAQPYSDVSVTPTVHTASGLSTPTAVQSAGSRTRSTGDERAVRVEASKDARAATPPPAASATRQRFVKKTAGARDRDVRQASPSASRTSGVGVDQRVTCDDNVTGHGASAVQLSSSADNAAVRATERTGYGTDSHVLSVTEAEPHSVANRVAMFEQRPVSSDSSLSLSSVDAASGTRQTVAPPSSCEDSRPSATAGSSSSAAAVRRQARLAAGQGRFRPSTSVAATTASASAEEEQGQRSDDEDPGFDDTRL